MKVLEYTLTGGFTESEFSQEWLEREELSSWLKRAGFEHYPAHEGLDSEREHGHSVGIHHATVDAAHGYAAIVDISDGCTSEFVLVRTAADLMNLRLVLTPLHVASALRRFDVLVTMAEKAFHAWHGHDSYEVCRDCDPIQWEIMRRRRLEAEKKDGAV